MSWYKKAIDMGDIEDRNIVNNTIDFFNEVKEALDKIAKLVFQDATVAKVAANDITNYKKLSSYPIIIDILREADTIVLDNPWKFAELCREASEEVSIRIGQLEKERKDFTEEELPKRMKGWVDSHGK